MGREPDEEAEDFLQGGAGAMGNVGNENVSGQDREEEPNQDDNERNRPSDTQDAEN